MNARSRANKGAQSTLRGIRLFPSSHYAILALFFFAGLELLFALQQWIVPLFAVLVAILVIGVVMIRAEEQGRFHPTQAILPVLIAIGIPAFGLFLPSTILLHGYFAGAALLFYATLKHGAKRAYPIWNWVISIIVLFVLLASVLGVQFHLYSPMYITISGTFIAIVLVSFQSLMRSTDHGMEALLLALVLAFGLSQVAWALQFLPFHYITEAGLVIALYYAAFQLIAAGLEDRKLTRRDITEYISISTLAIAILLVTAQWS